MLRVFVGYDAREAVAYSVCINSLIRRASTPVQIIPLALNALPFYQEQHRDGSNDFIYSRFLVPYLSGFNGWSLFVDGDMVFKDDVAKLFALAQADKDVMVVKHEYKTRAKKKYMGNKNEDYPRKNWSSVVLWNCGNYPNRRLLPEFVEQQTGAFLHRFEWLDNARIGELPLEWNWLVNEYDHNSDAKLLHYTLGIPAFKAYRNSDHAEDWWEEYNAMVELPE